MPGIYFPESLLAHFHEFPHVGQQVLGRNPECDVFLPDPKISRCHAVFDIESDRVTYLDRSRNGTQINNQWVHRHVLKGGDQIRVGRFLMEFLQETPARLQAAHLKQMSALATVTHNRVEIVGDSTSLREALQVARQAAKTDYPVLITGETGSGKELMAQEIHQQSSRSHQPLVCINCAALSPTLLESEIFGHERGAYTGAVHQHRGVFEVASEGTLFLDEIGEMPADLQPKLLRALEEKRIRRVGSAEEISVRTRILAATNRNLLEEVRNGKFRSDLYHRLNVFSVHVPALRERFEDLPALVDFLLEKAGLQKLLTPEALAKLTTYEWPGNVRELRNLLVRSGVLLPQAEIGADDILLPDPPHAVLETRFDFEHAANLPNAEARIIRVQLDRLGWNRVRVAEALGISRSTLFNKMRRYGMD